MLVLPYLKAAKESCVCGDNDTVYLYILPLSEWSSLDRILRPFQGGRCSAVSNLSGLWCRHHQWGQDQEQNVKMSLRSTISTLFLCQAFNQYLESRLLSCRLLLDQISKTQQVNEWYWWYCREHTSPTLEPEVTPQRTRPSMTKRCFSALRKREQRKPRKLRPLPRTATCYKVRLLSQLVHKAASVWHFELSPWEWSIVWPNIHQHHQLNLCCFYDLKCLQMTLCFHPRTGCPFDTSDCAVNFDSHVFWVCLLVVFESTRASWKERPGHFSFSWWLCLAQVGFVGKNQSVLLDRASKARVDSLAGSPIFGVEILQVFRGDKIDKLAWNPINKPPSIYQHLAESRWAQVDSSSVSDMETLVTSTMQSKSTAFAPDIPLGGPVWSVKTLVISWNFDWSFFEVKSAMRYSDILRYLTT